VGGTCGAHGVREKCLQDFVGMFEDKRPLGIHRCRLENKIKLDLRR